MFKSLLSLGMSTWFLMLSWYLIEGYWATGYYRPEVDEDGNGGLVVNDWWPITGFIGLVALVAGLVWLFQWMDDE